MSLASDWAALIADEDSRAADVMAAQPSSLSVSSLVASVTRRGELSLSGVILTQDEALQLAQWLTTTFQ